MRRPVALAAGALAASVLVVPGSSALGHEYGHRPGSGPATTLREGTAAQVGLVPEHVDAMVGHVRGFLAPSPRHPLYAGAVVLAAHDGVVVQRAAVGHAVRYADGEGTELPPGEQVPMREDTIVDLASVSKLVTAVVVVQQVEAGRLRLDEPVASYLPAFAANGKAEVTVEQLLTHTSGLPAWKPLYRDHDTVAEREAAVLGSELVTPPGTAYRYSDLNLITAGLLVEEVTGRELDVVVREDVTGPLGMDDTMYNPPPSLWHRVAATEDQPWTGRGVVRGTVHDENAWSLGGVAGHAGLFSTADDLAVLAQTLLNGGRYGDVRILSTASVDALFADRNTAFPGDAHGLGFEVDQRWYMDALSSPTTVGHTGYTGTSLVIDRGTRSFVVLLSNRVHPSREWGSNNPARRAVAHDLARALPVRPRYGPDAWFSGTGDSRTATLAAPVTLPEGAGAVLDFALHLDTETAHDDASGPDDALVLEASSDGGTGWRELGRWAGDGGRAWQRVQLPLAGLSGDVVLRWRYVTDAYYQGRGVHLDGVRVRDGSGRVLLDDRRPADADGFLLDGWSRSTD